MVFAQIRSPLFYNSLSFVRANKLRYQETALPICIIGIIIIVEMAMLPIYNNVW
jgi:hypothetical protein